MSNIGKPLQEDLHTGNEVTVQAFLSDVVEQFNKILPTGAAHLPAAFWDRIRETLSSTVGPSLSLPELQSVLNLILEVEAADFYSEYVEVFGDEPDEFAETYEDWFDYDCYPEYERKKRDYPRKKNYEAFLGSGGSNGEAKSKEYDNWERDVKSAEETWKACLKKVREHVASGTPLTIPVVPPLDLSTPESRNETLKHLLAAKGVTLRIRPGDRVNNVCDYFIKYGTINFPFPLNETYGGNNTAESDVEEPNPARADDDKFLEHFGVRWMADAMEESDFLHSKTRFSSVFRGRQSAKWEHTPRPDRDFVEYFQRISRNSDESSAWRYVISDYIKEHGIEGVTTHTRRKLGYAVRPHLNNDSESDTASSHQATSSSSQLVQVYVEDPAKAKPMTKDAVAIVIAYYESEFTHPLRIHRLDRWQKKAVAKVAEATGMMSRELTNMNKKGFTVVQISKAAPATVVFA